MAELEKPEIETPSEIENQKLIEALKKECSEPIPGAKDMPVYSFKELMEKFKSTALKAIVKSEEYKEMLSRGFVLGSGEQQVYYGEKPGRTPEGEPTNIHLGVDYMVKEGTEVAAIADGEVVDVVSAKTPIIGRKHLYKGEKGFGNMILIKHILKSGQEVYSLYGHLAYSKKHPKVWDTVKKGQIIGKVGKSFSVENGGWPSHLHFSILKEKEATAEYGTQKDTEKIIDPLEVFKKEVAEKPLEVKIETEEDIIKLGEKRIENIEKRAEEVINSGKERLEEANKTGDLGPERVEEVKTKTNVEQEVQNVQEEIQELTSETRDEIKEVTTGEKLAEEKPEEKEKIKEDFREQIKKINDELEKSKTRYWELNKKGFWHRTEEEEKEWKILKERRKELYELEKKLYEDYEEFILEETLSVLAPEKKLEEKEISPLIKEKMEVTEKKSRENITNFLKEFFRMANDGWFKEAGIKNAKEALERLKEEVEKVRESAFITINVPSSGILKLLEVGRFKSFLELSPKEQQKRNPGYVERRIRDEKIMGTYAKGTPEDPYTIYGALASRNGFDEIFGGASGWGKVFVILKPSVKERCVFFDGDSMAVDPEEIPNRLLNLEHATIAKGITNIQKAAGILKGFFVYIEASILGGVTMNDVESINISNSNAKRGMETETSPVFRAGYKKEYEKSKELIKEIKEKYPQYAHLVKEV